MSGGEEFVFVAFAQRGVYKTLKILHMRPNDVSAVLPCCVLNLHLHLMVVM